MTDNVKRKLKYQARTQKNENRNNKKVANIQMQREVTALLSAVFVEPLKTFKRKKPGYFKRLSHPEGESLL